jgi:hypothetical protein
MTLTDFLALDYKGKHRATSDGVCIGGRTEEGYIVLLYQLCSFYIEVFYQKEYNFISEFKAFDDTELLEPYLKKIELSLAR